MSHFVLVTSVFPSRGSSRAYTVNRSLDTGSPTRTSWPERRRFLVPLSSMMSCGRHRTKTMQVSPEWDSSCRYLYHRYFDRLIPSPTGALSYLPQQAVLLLFYIYFVLCIKNNHSSTKILVPDISGSRRLFEPNPMEKEMKYRWTTYFEHEMVQVRRAGRAESANN
ncbi:unnamed protein product [Choristocarpus tenellus]